MNVDFIRIIVWIWWMNEGRPVPSAFGFSHLPSGLVFYIKLFTEGGWFVYILYFITIKISIIIITLFISSRSKLIITSVEKTMYVCECVWEWVMMKYYTQCSPSAVKVELSKCMTVWVSVCVRRCHTLRCAWSRYILPARPEAWVKVSVTFKKVSGLMEE